MCLKVRVLPSFLGKQTELLWRRFKGVRAVRVPWTGAIRSLRNRSGMWSAESCHSFWPQKYWVTQEKWGSKFLSKPFVPRFIAFHRTRWATAFAKPSMISSSAPWPVESAAVLWCPKEWNLINSSGTNVVFLSWFSIDFCFLPYFFCGFVGQILGLGVLIGAIWVKWEEITSRQLWSPMLGKVFLGSFGISVFALVNIYEIYM